jgi:radical SAM protein with 4Fe4S-binding SPASM domain
MSCHIRLGDFEFGPSEVEAAARSGRLLSMEIEFSLRCNFNCPYCYVQGRPTSYKDEMTPEEARGVLKQACDLGARKIIVLGGEPMIYPQIFEMLQYIRGLGMTVEMFTNGTNITEETARRLGDLGVRVVLKMNSFEKAIQDELAGRKGAYESIQSAFASLREAGYPSEDRVLAISTIICKQNQHEIVRLWKWLRDQDIAPYFEVVTPHGSAGSLHALRVDSDVSHRIFQELSELDKAYGHTWEPQPPLVGNRCLRHQFSCLVNASGYVMPCVGVPIAAGNIREQPLADIIRDSEVIQDLRNYRQNIKGPCASCEKLDECYGCRGAAYHTTGDYMASDPTCWRNAGLGDKIMRLPMDVGDLIPQSPPMRVVDRLLEVGERSAVVELAIAQDTPFVGKNGELDEAAYLEIMAQSIAALNGFRKKRNGSIKPDGFLLGARNVEILGAARTGERLSVDVFKYARYGDFGLVRGTIRRGEDVIARGEVKVWHKSAGQEPG